MWFAQHMPQWTRNVAQGVCDGHASGHVVSVCLSVCAVAPDCAACVRMWWVTLIQFRDLHV